MTAIPPILVRFDGENFVPSNVPMLRRAIQHFEKDATYAIEFKDGPSDLSRRHLMACIGSAWRNLKETDQDRWPSPEHLRKWATVRAGYSTERHVVCESAQVAKEVAVLARSLDEFAVITLKGNVVRVYTAQSMSRRPGAMDRATFGTAKTVILGIVSDLIGVDATTLATNPAESDDPEPARNGSEKATSAPDALPPPAKAQEPPAHPAPRAPQSAGDTVTGSPADAPPPSAPGGLSRPNISPAPDGVAVGASGQTEQMGGGEPPHGFRSYRAYIENWLYRVTSTSGIRLRYASDQESIWPDLRVPLEPKEKRFLDQLVENRIRTLEKMVARR